MRVTNQLEPTVMKVLGELTEMEAAGYAGCRCPLCRADTAALALTNLPPRYATVFQPSNGGDNGEKGTVFDAVTAASRRVLACPRHGLNKPEKNAATVRMVNYIFEEIARLVLVCSLEEESRCFCERCTADMMAYSLNRYPSKYGVLWRGTQNLQEYHRESLREDLDKVLKRAAEVIALRPTH